MAAALQVCKILIQILSHPYLKVLESRKLWREEYPHPVEASRLKTSVDEKTANNYVGDGSGHIGDFSDPLNSSNQTDTGEEPHSGQSDEELHIEAAEPEVG